MKCVKIKNHRRLFDSRSIWSRKQGNAEVFTGCPKGKFDGSTDNCAVRWKEHKIVRRLPPGRHRCPRGYRHA